MTDPTSPPASRPPRQRRPRRRRNTLRQRFIHSDFFDRASAGVLRFLIGVVSRLGRERASRYARRLARLVGRLTPENRMARDSLRHAFPDRTQAERDAILTGAWENFAEVAVEFVFLEELAAAFDPTHPDRGPITVSGIDHFVALRDDGKPAVIIAAHLANWEILGVVAHKFGLKSVLPFRAPANFHLAGDMLATREALMGTLVENNRGASFRIAAALDRGEHLGMLVDQRLGSGLDVPFFGRPALTNPLAAKFARQYDCPVHGARAVRLPGGRLHLELGGPIDLPRDADGLIDVAAATAAINLIVEGWVREHPDQWFWLHNRWKH